MDLEARARRIGHHIGWLAIIGIIAFGAQLHRFFPFIGPAIGIGVLLVSLQIAGKAYGRHNQPKLEGLDGDALLAQQIRIAIVIRRFAAFFCIACLLSFVVI